MLNEIDPVCTIAIDKAKKKFGEPIGEGRNRIAFRGNHLSACMLFPTSFASTFIL